MVPRENLTNIWCNIWRHIQVIWFDPSPAYSAISLRMKESDSNCSTSRFFFLLLSHRYTDMNSSNTLEDWETLVQQIPTDKNSVKRAILAFPFQLSGYTASVFLSLYEWISFLWCLLKNSICRMIFTRH